MRLKALRSCAAQPSAHPLAPVRCDGDCAFASELNGWLNAGNLDTVIGHAQSQMYTCPGGDQPTGLGGPYPLCNGATAEQSRSGYAVGQLGSEGQVLSASDYQEYLRMSIQQAMPAATDEYGSGGLWLFRLGCSDGGANDAPPCPDQFFIAFSEIRQYSSGLKRVVLLFHVRQGDNGAPTVVLTQSGVDTLLSFPLSGGSFTTPAAPSAVFFPWNPAS